MNSKILFGESAKLIKNTVNPSDFKDMPYIGLEHIEQNTLKLSGNGKANEVTSTKLSFKKDDILFGKLRSYFRKVVQAPFDGICSTDIWVVRARKGVDRNFLFYWMASKKFIDEATRGSEGTRMPRAKWEFVSRIECPVTSLNEQKNIGRILKALDDKIELNRQMCKTLKDIAGALFKSWFVDFDPVNAKAQGRMPEGLSPEIANLFPDRFVDSPIGKIPQGWDLMKLGKISEIHNGFAFKSQDYRENGIYILRTKNFSNDGYATRLKDDVFLNVELANAYKKYLCQAFDYHLVMVGNSVGKTAYILPHILPALRNQNMWCFRPKSKSQSRFYLNQAVEYKVKSVIGWASGSARSFFRKSDFQSYDILWPPEEIQAVFEEVTSSIYKKLSSLYEQNIGLSQTRDALLPKLISGKLKLKTMEEYCVP